MDELQVDVDGNIYFRYKHGRNVILSETKNLRSIVDTGRMEMDERCFASPNMTAIC